MILYFSTEDHQKNLFSSWFNLAKNTSHWPMMQMHVDQWLPSLPKPAQCLSQRFLKDSGQSVTNWALSFSKTTSASEMSNLQSVILSLFSKAPSINKFQPMACLRTLSCLAKTQPCIRGIVLDSSQQWLQSRPMVLQYYYELLFLGKKYVSGREGQLQLTCRQGVWMPIFPHQISFAVTALLDWILLYTHCVTIYKYC